MDVWDIGSDRANYAFPSALAHSTSLKSPSENIFQFPPQLVPSPTDIPNFVQVWQTNPLGSICLTVP
jgi:putative chitobiose transport system permease protein